MTVQHLILILADAPLLLGQDAATTLVLTLAAAPTSRLARVLISQDALDLIRETWALARAVAITTDHATGGLSVPAQERVYAAILLDQARPHAQLQAAHGPQYLT